MSREAALAAFDEARDRFLAAFERVPDDALGFLKPGDELALGGLLPHVTWGLEQYGQLLDTIVAGGFGEMRKRLEPAELERIAAVVRRGIDAEGRPAELGSLREAHAHLAGRVRALPEADYEHAAPVFYGDAAEAHPTSAAVIMGWMTGHYDEHVPQIADLLTEAEAATG